MVDTALSLVLDSKPRYPQMQLLMSLPDRPSLSRGTKCSNTKKGGYKYVIKRRQRDSLVSIDNALDARRQVLLPL